MDGARQELKVQGRKVLGRRFEGVILAMLGRRFEGVSLAMLGRRFEGARQEI